MSGFGGTIRRTMAASEPWWPERTSAPPGAPDIIVILVDDLGFADLGCYGSEIPTPHLDALAARGVRWGSFHTAPMCSPTRASILTGLHPHAAGFGLVANTDPGFPGYTMELADDVQTLPEILRANGYATAAVGKWHLSKEADNHDAGNRRSWPLQRGFDRFYGFLEGFTSFHHPHRLVQGNDAITVDEYPEGYYLTDDLTDRAIDYLQSVDANAPGTPLFLYVAHAAVHAPLQAKATDIERHRGRYDAGWDEVRAARFARQLDLGVLPAGIRLPPRNTEQGADVRPWDELSADERLLASRTMEVYAAMVDNLDQNVGRLLDASARLGRLDNTVVVFMSDNGASREGEALGTAQYLRTVITGQIGDPSTSLARDLRQIDELGGPTTLPHYPRGWGMASGTPWRLYKQHTYAGGHTVPFIVAGPGIPAGDVRFQYQHATDLLPTLVELAGATLPVERQGVPVRDVHGASFAAALADADVPSTHPEQHYAMMGHRGFYRDGWEVVTNHQALTPFGDHEWALFDLTTDPSELNDLAAEHPERVAELSAAWEAAAWAHDVFPLDEGAGIVWLSRPDSDQRYSQPVTLLPGTPTLERWRAVQLIQTRAVRIEIDVVETGEGVLVAHGGQGGGYSAYVEGGRLFVAYNEYGDLHTLDAGTLSPGAHAIELELTVRERLRWDVMVRVDGTEAARLDDVSMLFAMAPFEGIDVGVDRRSPVSWPVYQRHGAFAFRGALGHVRYVPGPIAPDAPAAMLEILRKIGVGFE
jgi:arylsulfatase A-like enzyme